MRTATVSTVATSTATATVGTAGVYRILKPLAPISPPRVSADSFGVPEGDARRSMTPWNPGNHATLPEGPTDAPLGHRPWKRVPCVSGRRASGRRAKGAFPPCAARRRGSPRFPGSSGPPRPAWPRAPPCGSGLPSPLADLRSQRARYEPSSSTGLRRAVRRSHRPSPALLGPGASVSYAASSPQPPGAFSRARTGRGTVRAPSRLGQETPEPLEITPMREQQSPTSGRGRQGPWPVDHPATLFEPREQLFGSIQLTELDQASISSGRNGALFGSPAPDRRTSSHALHRYRWAAAGSPSRSSTAPSTSRASSVGPMWPDRSDTMRLASLGASRFELPSVREDECPRQCLITPELRRGGVTQGLVPIAGS